MKTVDPTVHTSERRLAFFDGIKSGIPIAFGYIPIAIAFGLLAKSAGVPNYIAILMSLMIFAGASQFVGINLIALGTNPWEIVLTTFILNLRHLLMAASISQKLEAGSSKKYLSILSFGITDETFSVASLREELQLKPEFVFGLNLLAFSAWNVGTWMGVFLAEGLPESIKASMNIAIYAMFIGLLVPSCRKSNPILFISLLAMTIHSLLYFAPGFSWVSTGSRIVITTVVTAIVAAIVFPEEGSA